MTHFTLDCGRRNQLSSASLGCLWLICLPSAGAILEWSPTCGTSFLGGFYSFAGRGRVIGRTVGAHKLGRLDLGELIIDRSPSQPQFKPLPLIQHA